MIIKEAVRHNCPTCSSSRLISDEEYGCDQCKKPITLGISGKHRSYLDASVHHNIKGAEHLHFCSWKCALTKLSKIKTDYFISLPFLTYDGPNEKGMKAKDFFAAVKAFK